jgi:hypothetical protein
MRVTVSRQYISPPPRTATERFREKTFHAIRLYVQLMPLNEITDLRVNALAHGPFRWFRDWPDASVPYFAAGIYTIWDAEGRFIYVGMSGRSIKAGMAIPNRPHGLVTRLHSHAQGRRSGDQFCVYVADRLVLSTLTAEDFASVASGRHSLDAYVRRYIHQHLGYRFSVCGDGAEAAAIQRQIKRGEWPMGKPLLNPQPDARSA